MSIPSDYTHTHTEQVCSVLTVWLCVCGQNRKTIRRVSFLLLLHVSRVTCRPIISKPRPAAPSEAGRKRDGLSARGGLTFDPAVLALINLLKEFVHPHYVSLCVPGGEAQIHLPNYRDHSLNL